MQQPAPLQALLNLTGKAAIVTGGAKGIGHGIAYRLAEAGASVLVADVDEAEGRKAAKEFTNKGWTASFIITDAAIESEVKVMVEACRERYGAVDILVNNAGIYPPAPLASMSQADFDKVVQVNLRSVFLATKYAAEVMKRVGNGGRIINITSINVLHPTAVGLAHYDASKNGVWSFTKNSALELAEHKIWVNAIAPGGVQTPGVAALQATLLPAGVDPQQMIQVLSAKIPMRRGGEPDDIGKVALFLASDMAGYMTGEQIVVDGGALLTPPAAFIA